MSKVKRTNINTLKRQNGGETFMAYTTIRDVKTITAIDELCTATGWSPNYAIAEALREAERRKIFQKLANNN